MPTHNGIFYTDKGNGPTVLLIHGFCETHELWAPIEEILQHHFRFIAIDLPGFGQSDPLNETVTIKAVARKLLEFMYSLDETAYAVVAHSLGGYVMLEMANQNRNPLTCLGLFHSTSLADTTEKKSSRDKVVEFVKKNGVATFIESFIPPLFYDQTLPSVKELVNIASRTPLETVVNYTRAMRDREGRIDVLKKFEKPILFIAGESDPGITLASMQDQVAMTMKPVFASLADVAHMGMLEQPAATAEILKKFLRQL